MIELRTLGTLELSSADGTPLGSVLAQPRRTALLCYLALESPRGFQRRDTLYALFWPDHSTEHARHALRQSLYFLRHELGHEAIVSRSDDAVAVAPDRIRCDAVELERAGDSGGATKWGRYAAGFSPTDETELRRLLLLLDRVGDRAAALRAFESF